MGRKSGGRNRGKKNAPQEKKGGLSPSSIIIVIAVIVALGMGYILVSESGRELSEGRQPEKGAAEAKVTIVEYSDFECPACGAMAPVISEIIKRYSKEVKVVYKNFPLADHKWAFVAAKAGECAFDQGKFWEFHDILFARQRSWSNTGDAMESFMRYAGELGLDKESFSSCVDSGDTSSRVKSDRKEGSRFNIRTTPTFFVNGKRVAGVWKYRDFEMVIQKAIKSASEKK